MSEISYLYRSWDFEHHFADEKEPRQWKLERPKGSTRLAYSKYLEEKILSRFTRHREAMGEAACDRAIREWSKGAVSDDCGWRSEEFWLSLKSPESCKELFWLWVGQAESELPRSQKLPRAKVEELWESRGADCCALLNEMIHEKNPTHAPAPSGAKENI